MNDFLKLTLTETIALIKNRKVSVKEIIETYIKRLNETKKFNMLSEKENYESVNHTALMKNISTLDRRAQDIIRARWLDDHKLTLNELADKYSVSAERIRQIEASAFKKLKTSLVNV